MVKTKKKAKKGFSKIFKRKVKPKKKKPVRHVVKMKKAGVKKPVKRAVRKPSVRKPSKTKEKEFVVGFTRIFCEEKIPKKEETAEERKLVIVQC